ncbi:MAG: fasciclin domain-containing protein [Pseudomonadota bacterium]
MATIAEIATGSDSFNILVNALTFIDTELPGTNLIPTLSDATQDLTVFAPNDAAFGQVAVDLGFAGDTADENAVTTFLATTLGAETLRDIVLYHVSAGGKTLAQVGALATVETLNGATITPDAPTLVDQEPDLIDPSLVNTDILADNGVVHEIDRVLLPLDLPGNDASTIAGIVAASGGTPDADNTDFDILLTAVTAAGLVGALDDATADLTVFAPTDAAFIATAQALGFAGTDEAGALDFLLDAFELLGAGDTIGLLTTVLTYHVVPESLQASQVLSATTIPTLQGGELTVNGTSLGDLDPDLPDPNIIATDIQAANGVVHAIDGVLLPADILQSNGLGTPRFIIDDGDNTAFAGSRDNDFISGKGGNDIIIGGLGIDVLLGGEGNDIVVGNVGNDSLFGGAGDDFVIDGVGNDVLSGGAGRDLLRGGVGTDTFVIASGDEREIVLDYVDGTDMIDVTDYGFTDISDLQIFDRVFGTAVRVGQETLVLRDVNSAVLDNGDFLFA